MAEIRRRRKCSGDESDILSDVSNDILIKSHSEQGSDVDNSDYESIEEGQIVDEEDEEIAAITAENKGEVEEKKLDDDEDRKNPQYIPKKGTFYEHDNRIGSENDENEKAPSESGETNEVKKKIWKENDKWSHDKFDLNDQTPKSQDELVATYGYDIRNEEGPPRARRRRRYARGPSKYTRSWEDQEAYKPIRGRSAEPRGRGRGTRGHNINSESDFPSLRANTASDSDRNYSREGQEKLETVGDNGELAVNASNHAVPTENRRENRDRNDQNYPNSHRDDYSSYRGRGGGGGYSRGRRGSDFRYNRDHYSEGRGKNDRGSYRGRSDRGAYTSTNSNSADRREDVKEVTDMLKSTEIVSQKDDFRLNRNNNKKANVPPRLQEKPTVTKISPSAVDGQSKTTKRYSSQRQRAVVDQSSYQPTYYDQDHPKHSTPSKNFVQTAYTPPTTTFPAETYLARVPATQIIAPAPIPHLIAGPALAAPASITGAVSGPTALAGSVIGQNQTPNAGPAVTCPPYLGSENIINYGPTPGIVAAPPQFPPFQAFTTVPQVPPTEIYRNGVTYYNTQNQQHPRIAVPLQKRPKAAIPILPPPEDESEEVKSEDLGYQEQSVESNDGYSFSPREYENVYAVGNTIESDDVIPEDSNVEINSNELYEDQECFTCDESVSSNTHVPTYSEEFVESSHSTDGLIHYEELSEFKELPVNLEQLENYCDDREIVDNSEKVEVSEGKDIPDNSEHVNICESMEATISEREEYDCENTELSDNFKEPEEMCRIMKVPKDSDELENVCEVWVDLEKLKDIGSPVIELETSTEEVVESCSNTDQEEKSCSQNSSVVEKSLDSIET